jgi:hypothetical protein
MAKLAKVLLTGAHKDSVVAETVQLIERYVGSRTGFKGIGMKTGLAMLKAARPDIVQRATNKLLPEVLDQLDAFHAEFKAINKPAGGFSAFLAARAAPVSSALLRVVDQRADASSNTAVKSVYKRFRGGAEQEVAGIVPELGAIIDRYASTV